IEYFLNGKSIGTPFKDIKKCKLLPTVSLFGESEVQCDFENIPEEISAKYGKIVN
ncbi:MAG: hypothetical protein MHPSP_002639, partial [Paramarteilia canceri]